jgi:hypothetical protein
MWIFVRTRGVAELLLMTGVIGLLGGTLHHCFISFGMTYHWFKMVGTDGWVFRGSFEPQENPVLLFISYGFRIMVVLAYVGIFLLAARLVRKHLSLRLSERPTALGSHSR